MSHREKYHALLQYCRRSGFPFHSVFRPRPCKSSASATAPSSPKSTKPSKPWLTPSLPPPDFPSTSSAKASTELPTGPATNGRTRMIIDPIDGTEEFSRGIPTFGTLIGSRKRRNRCWHGQCTGPLGRQSLVGIPRRGRVSQWPSHRGLAHSRLADSMVFTTGTGPTKSHDARAALRRFADAARNGRSMGGFWQHMLLPKGH